MNCINHPSEGAVAQCVDCGKGLCSQCAADQKISLCIPCHQARNRKAVIGSALFLVVYAVLFAIGYKSNFMSSKGTPDARLLSGYTLMAIVSGWQFLNSIIRWRLIQGTLVTWAIYYLLKFFAATVVGFITAPFTILWNLVKIVRNSIR